MKRVVFLILAGCMIFCMASCAKKNLPADDSVTMSPEPTAVTTDAEENLSVTETEIMIHPGEWALPATLTLPGGEGPFPLVVFVHGSGPSDRDETMGKIKVFKDLAADLAQQGIATIRYDKRTYLYASKMASDVNLTVQEETVEDVLHAVAYGKADKKIDADHIFVAGHSLGGYLIPRIDQADENGDIAGYISLAGSARPIMDLLLEQTEYILSVTPGVSEADRTAQLQLVSDAQAAVANLTEADAGSSNMIMGAHPSYWLDLADYQPAQEAKNVQEPMLFLWGEHDYQVTEKDFDIWKAALEGRENVLFKQYPKLTHSFTPTEEMGRPEDYQTFANVDPEVAEDIGTFVLDHLR